MRKDKIITMLLIGAAVGTIAGLLFTDKGKQISSKLKEQGGGLLDTLCDAFDKGKTIVNEYAEKFTEKATDVRDRAEDVANGAQKHA